MNATQKPNSIEIKFAKESQAVIEVKPASAITKLKEAVFAEFQGALKDNEQLLRLALIEADALAQQTDFPQLVYPLLAAEKAQNAARWQFRQRFLLRSNSPYALAA